MKHWQLWGLLGAFFWLTSGVVSAQPLPADPLACARAGDRCVCLPPGYGGLCVELGGYLACDCVPAVAHQHGCTELNAACVHPKSGAGRCDLHARADMRLELACKPPIAQAQSACSLGHPCICSGGVAGMCLGNQAAQCDCTPPRYHFDGCQQEGMACEHRGQAGGCAVRVERQGQVQWSVLRCVVP